MPFSSFCLRSRIDGQKLVIWPITMVTQSVSWAEIWNGGLEARSHENNAVG